MSTDATEPAGPTVPGDSAEPRSKEQIEADLEATREHLAETVDALGHKLDVKARSREKVAAVKDDHGRELAIGGAAAAVLVVLVVVWRRRRR